MGGGPGGGSAVAPHPLGATAAPHRDCLLLSSVFAIVPCREVDNELLLGATGRFAGLPPGQVGSFLKSFNSRSMLVYVLDPQTNPSGEMPMVWCLGVLFITKRRET